MLDRLDKICWGEIEYFNKKAEEASGRRSEELAWIDNCENKD